jgi:hypothetical protein
MERTTLGVRRAIREGIALWAAAGLPLSVIVATAVIPGYIFTQGLALAIEGPDAQARMQAAVAAHDMAGAAALLGRAFADLIASAVVWTALIGVGSTAAYAYVEGVRTGRRIAIGDAYAAAATRWGRQVALIVIGYLGVAVASALAFAVLLLALGFAFALLHVPWLTTVVFAAIFIPWVFAMCAYSWIVFGVAQHDVALGISAPTPALRAAIDAALAQRHRPTVAGVALVLAGAGALVVAALTALVVLVANASGGAAPAGAAASPSGGAAGAFDVVLSVAMSIVFPGIICGIVSVIATAWSGERGGAELLREPGDDECAAFPDRGDGTTGADRALIARFLANRDGLEPVARANVAATIAARVRPQLNASFAHLDDEALLEHLGRP